MRRSRLTRRERRLLMGAEPRMPAVGDTVTVVSRFAAGGGYVQAGDLVVWAEADAAARYRPGHRCTLINVSVVDGVPVVSVGDPPDRGDGTLAGAGR